MQLMVGRVDKQTCQVEDVSYEDGNAFTIKVLDDVKVVFNNFKISSATYWTKEQLALFVSDFHICLMKELVE